MPQDKIEQLETNKIALEKIISDLENEMREHSRRVSEIQVDLLEKRGERKGLEKIINLMKK